ncbi:amidohydrolase family protein [Janibacter sp. HTCC2649]|uniref:amidohydrolase family protein n=1 Tax=Janibacter sp. HTCC2649 TaxID=313589 RepID=UPI00031A51D6|nr:amidohydrolase family protein [Janibacter sp. HTCC2649]
MNLDPSLVDGPLAEALAHVGLIDHHVHGALRATPERRDWEALVTEAPAAPAVGSIFDSQVGLAMRRWCAPLLDLEPHAPADDYWARRTELGEQEVTRRLLTATGVDTWLVETGFQGDLVLGPAEMAAVTGTAREIVRLETVAEGILRDTGADGFHAAYAPALAQATQGAVGTKSVIAYRHGFDIPAERPSASEVTRAAGRTLATDATLPRISDPVLLRHLLWCAVDLGLPIQMHSGYGDPDLDLHRANPLLLMPWLRAVEPTGVPVLLLHNYPFHREAGYLAQVFDVVHCDVGLAINYTGARSPAIIAESLELTPFHKQLYSSDAWGPAELHLLGSWLWRRGMARVLGTFVDDGDWSIADAQRVVHLVAYENARRVYRLG